MEQVKLPHWNKRAEGVSQNGGNSELQAKNTIHQNPGIIDPPKKLPKEFRKSYFKAADWRFVAILAISFFAHYFLIYYLFVHLPHSLDEDFIIKIQNQFASRFLSNAYEEEGQTQERTYQDLLKSASDWAQNLVEQTLNPAKIAENLPVVTPKPDITKVKEPSYEARAQARKSAAAMRHRAMAILRDDVKTIGLLGIITGGSGLVSVSEVEDILNYADTSAAHIKERIEQVSSLRVPRPGRDFFGKGLGEDNNVYLKERKSRARRVLASGIKANEFVGNLAEAREEKVNRTKTFQKVSNLSAPYLGLRSGLDRVYARRSIQRIREVVLSHNLAIQDCYRQELKLDPQLKGKVTVRFTIAIDGSVTEAEIVHSTMNLPRLENCILQRIRRWNDFGQVSPEQGSISIRHTYVFGY